MRILKWTAMVGGSLSLVLIAVSAALIRFRGPRNLIGYIRYDQRQEGTLVAGHDTPDVELFALDGASRVHVREWIGQTRSCSSSAASRDRRSGDRSTA